MSQDTFKRILALVRQASKVAQSAGISNLLQPGLVKEMIIAEILGHELIISKNDSDAHAAGNRNRRFEYLSCKERGTGQLDRMFKKPPADREKSLKRITRNFRIYFAVFYALDQMKCKVIYELKPGVVEKEARRKLKRSKNSISHIGFSEKWAKENGTIVFKDQT